MGRVSPVNALAKNGVPPRNPQSVRFTVVACTLTSTSSSRTVGRGTSITCTTSGGPYRVWTAASM